MCHTSRRRPLGARHQNGRRSDCPPLRYGTDRPEASEPSRFLEEIPHKLLEDLGGSRRWSSSAGFSRPRGPSHPGFDSEGAHYSYEDEDQSQEQRDKPEFRDRRPSRPERRGGGYSGPKYNSIDNIAEFFASRGKKFPMPKVAADPDAKPGQPALRPGQRVRHPKYGEGVVYRREGEGESAKITVQFPRFGLKKLVEKYAQLERA